MVYAPQHLKGVHLASSKNDITYRYRQECKDIFCKRNASLGEAKVYWAKKCPRQPLPRVIAVPPA